MDRREKVSRAIAESDGHDWDACTESQRGEYRANADAAIAALEPVDRPRVKPRVKPLVWDLWDGGMIAAKTASGTYNLSQNLRLCLPNGSYRHYGTEETAKAAAQADYEARILAALEPVTVQEAARVLLGHTPKITAKPLAEMSEAMKIDAHPAILLRGFCAAIRAIAEGKDHE